MAKRVLGKFPVFAEKAKMGKLHTVTGKAVTPAVLSSYLTDRIGYEEGFNSQAQDGCCKAETQVTPEKLNGVLNFITNHLGYLFERGIPEFSLNMAYPKGAVVVHDDELYISKVAENKHHVGAALYWRKLTGEVSQPVAVAGDANPVGTILTVPVSVNPDKYIPYVEGQSFNQVAYPELFQALGTNQFGGTSGSTDNSLPVGSITHVLTNAPVPEGWVEWNSYVNLLRYPELKEVVKSVVQGLNVNDPSRMVWEEALQTNTLPRFPDVYFKGASSYVGSYGEAKVGNVGFDILPVVLDESSTLNTAGMYRANREDRVYSPVAGTDVKGTFQESKIVLMANRTDKYANLTEVNMVSVNSSSTGEPEPAHINTRVLIKASSTRVGLPVTHKQVIKAWS